MSSGEDNLRLAARVVINCYLLTGFVQSKINHNLLLGDLGDCFWGNNQYGNNGIQCCAVLSSNKKQQQQMLIEQKLLQQQLWLLKQLRGQFSSIWLIDPANQ